MRRGEVWLISLDPTLGSEIGKSRPAVIVSNNEIGVLPLKVVVPITEWKDRFAIAPWLVRLEPETGNGITKISAADAFQVRSISQTRFVWCLGKLSDSDASRISGALAQVLDIGP